MTDSSDRVAAEDAVEPKAQVAKDSDPNLPLLEKSGRLDRAKTIAKVLNGVSMAAIVWGLFFPRPNQVMILFLAGPPLITIVLLVRFTNLYHIGGLRGDQRPSLGPAFLGCGLVLFIRALQDINLHPLYWLTTIISSLLIGGILTLAVVRADARTREGTWAIILLVASIYSYGAIAEADTFLDGSTPRITEVLVLSKHSSSRGRGSTSWFLHVEKWGPFLEPNNISVPGPFYQSVSPGQTVCIRLYSGALNIPWYSVTACR